MSAGAQRARSERAADPMPKFARRWGSAPNWKAVRNDPISPPDRDPCTRRSAAATPASKYEEDSRDDLKKEAGESSFRFRSAWQQVYDGPLDLLLDLIRKQDIDIYDIPIAKITAQFLGYVEHLKETDVDVAGDFIYTAALLIHIKSKMLLPRSPAETAEGEAEDPRRELVERLLEHERFKNAAQMLHAEAAD